MADQYAGDARRILNDVMSGEGRGKDTDPALLLVSVAILLIDKVDAVGHRLIELREVLEERSG